MAPDPSIAERRSILYRLLTPVVRHAIRRSILFPEIVAILKSVFIDIAQDEIRRSTQKVNVSRLSLLTGINRKDITERLANPDQALVPRIGIPSRVITHWEQDKRFLNQQGKPRVLSCDGEGSEFFELVAAVSTDFNPSTVLFELQRSGSAELTSRGVKLIGPASFVGRDEQRAMDLMAKDIETLGCVVQENMKPGTELGHMHLRTEYDNIYVKNLAEIRLWIVREGAAFHKRVRDYLSGFDRDLNPHKASQGGQAGARVVVSSFALSDDPPKESD